MHNIKTNFSKFYGICKALFKEEIYSKKNFQRHPVLPKMNDLEIISLACCMEALSIDSENLLWSKLKTDYAAGCAAGEGKKLAQIRHALSF